MAINQKGSSNEICTVHQKGKEARPHLTCGHFCVVNQREQANNHYPPTQAGFLFVYDRRGSIMINMYSTASKKKSKKPQPERCSG